MWAGAEAAQPLHERPLPGPVRPLVLSPGTGPGVPGALSPWPCTLQAPSQSHNQPRRPQCVCSRRVLTWRPPWGEALLPRQRDARLATENLSPKFA